MNPTEQDLETLNRGHNLYVGQLTPEEIASFQRCIDAGLTYRDYNHAGGLLGLAKVGVNQ